MENSKPEAATMPVNTSRVGNSSEDINTSSNVYDAMVTTEKPKVLTEDSRDKRLITPNWKSIYRTQVDELIDKFKEEKNYRKMHFDGDYKER